MPKPTKAEEMSSFRVKNGTAGEVADGSLGNQAAGSEPRKALGVG